MTRWVDGTAILVWNCFALVIGAADIGRVVGTPSARFKRGRRTNITRLVVIDIFSAAIADHYLLVGAAVVFAGQRRTRHHDPSIDPAPTPRAGTAPMTGREPMRTKTAAGEASGTLTGRWLVSPVEAAQLLGIGRTKVYELMAAGHLRPIHIGVPAGCPSKRSVTTRNASATTGDGPAAQSKFVTANHQVHERRRQRAGIEHPRSVMSSEMKKAERAGRILCQTFCWRRRTPGCWRSWRAADDLITELVAEDGNLRSGLAHGEHAEHTRRPECTSRVSCSTRWPSSGGSPVHPRYR